MHTVRSPRKRGHITGLDPDNLLEPGAFDAPNEARAWETLWSAGHGVGSIRNVPTAAELCRRLTTEYRTAVAEMSLDAFAVSRSFA